MNKVRLRRVLALMSALSSLWGAGHVAATDRYVATNGNDGAHSAWSSAYTNIQDALTAAGNGDTIYLAGHTFVLTNQLVWAARTNVAIRGGYAATNDADQPGPYSAATWPTVLTRASAYSNRIMIVTNVYTGTLDRVTITGGYLTNAGTFGGGLHIVGSPGMVISACVISNNAVAVTGNGQGGGLYVKTSVVALSNCLVKGNTVAGGSTSYGGGIYIDSSATVTLRDSIIANNSSIGSSRYGGGIMNYGTCRMTNCLMVANTTLAGNNSDGIFQAGTFTLDQCTVAYHPAQGISQAGGTATITNSIIWGNGDDISGSPTLLWSDVGDGDGNGVNGCISADPLFDRLYYLAPNSPCVDAGTNTASDRGMAGYTTRVDGSTDVGRVDLGYHYPVGFDVSGLDVYVTTNGDNGNSGTNWVSAYRTITKALSVARDGTRVHVGAGSYTNGSETFPLTVANLTGVQILGTNRATTVINAAGSSTRVLTLTNALDVILTELTFTGGYQTNSASACGGGIALWNCGGVFSGCVISNNTLAVTGNGNGGGLYSKYSALIMSNCLVKGNNNVSSANSYGGGIYIDTGTVTLRDSIIANNRCTGNSRIGAGIQNYGTCRLRNCLVVANTTLGGQGDGFYANNGSLTLDQCTVAYNTGQGIYGGGILTNSIVWGNGDDLLGGSWTLSRSDIEDGDGNGVNGCISTDPLFEGPYYLATNSPCVDAGTNTASDRGLSGSTTRVDGDYDSGRVDLGYHYTTGYDQSVLDVYVATNGDNIGHGGTSWADAYRTITKALAVARDGTRVHIGAGSYTNGSETFPLTVATLTGVQILGTNRATTVINAAGSSNRVLALNNCPGVSLSELTFTGGYQTNANDFYGGGIALWTCAGAVLSGCVISNNTLSVTGNGYGGGLSLSNCIVSASNCLVKGNTVFSTYSLGGGIYSEKSEMTLRDSIIANNQCAGGGRYGAGVYGTATWLMRNCLVVANTTLGNSAGGDGLYVGAVTLDNCTVAYNTGQGLNGGGLVTNSIFWGNGDDIAGAPTLKWSDIGNGDNNGISGCISADPLFQGGYYLTPNSPCVDAGTNTVNERGLTSYTTRVDGSNDSGRVDLGYHYPTGLDLSASADLYVAMNGNNGNSGTNWVEAYRTITKALSVARDGTWVHVGAGSYTNGSETFPLAVANLTGVQILGANRTTTVINAAGSSNRVLTLNSCPGVTVSEVTLTGGYVTNNGCGGGIALWSCNGSVLSDCIITNNTVAPVAANSPAYGGGVYSSNSAIFVKNCLVQGNTANASGSGGSSGGGLFLTYGIVTVSNCVVLTNTAKSGSGQCTGGGLAMWSATGTLRDSIFANNQSGPSSGGRYAGGLYVTGVRGWLRNCLVVENTTLASAGSGGGIYGDTALENCTVANNGISGIAWGTTVSNSIVWGNGDDICGNTPTLSWSDIGNGDNYGNNGCISNNPLFVNTNAADYRLTSKSPCLNTGTNQAWMLTSRDLIGNKRLQGNSVDMGPYECAPDPGTMFVFF
jgi:hypothetical protein